jgi:hypothetical protein
LPAAPALAATGVATNKEAVAEEAEEVLLPVLPQSSDDMEVLEELMSRQMSIRSGFIHYNFNECCHR